MQRLAFIVPKDTLNMFDHGTVLSVNRNLLPNKSTFHSQYKLTAAVIADSADILIKIVDHVSSTF